MENDKNIIENEQEGKTLRELLIIVRNNLWLMLAIVFIFIGLGIGYSAIESPSFTASRKLIFTCENLSNYNGISTNTTQNNVSTMTAYAETVMDFCDEGVVVDRANRYYINYCNEKDLFPTITVEDYIAEIEGNGEPSVTQVDEEIVATNIVVKSLSEDGSTQFAFQVNYTDVDKAEAYDKLKILVYAFKKEVLATKENSQEIKYFGEFKVHVEDLDSMGVVSNTSKTKNLIIFTFLGVVLAILVVYIKTIANNTITTKDELERIVGAPVFAAVENKE